MTTPSAPPETVVHGPPPQEVVTFLFSDIEGSTRLLQTHRSSFGPALARHHRVLAGIIEDQGGRVFETVGDAVYAAFAHPAAAILAAAAIGRALAEGPPAQMPAMRVRQAIHTGTVEVRGRHYYGPALFECARVMSLAHGGQVLTTPTTAALLGPEPLVGISLRSLGRHRLRDLDQPMEVLQVDVDGLTDAFPPLRVEERVPTNLPHEITAFVGRATELAEVGALLQQQRLVTLLGPGGSGKTRLALELAARRRERQEHGAWLVELAPIRSPDLVLAELADTWSLRAGEGASLVEVVERYLAQRQLLLLLDNCEHVREAAAQVVRDLLRVAPGLTVLATSRESLGVPGEVEYRVPPLPVPGPDDGHDTDAVRLFLDRVSNARPGFEPTATELDAAVRISRRVEGMPLGLELAAARARTLSLPDLATRLERSFRTLGSGPKTALPHQRTLQATLDWSHDLLDAGEQRLYRRLSAFAGSFDVAAVEAICAEDDEDVLERLDSLVDKSLVLAVDGPATRFRLLEPIRQDAAARLAAAAERERIQTAHAGHYANFVHAATPALRGPDQLAQKRRIELEYDNVRLALAYLLARGQVEHYLRLAFDLFTYWMHQALQVEGMAILLAGLERASDAVDVSLRVKGWFVVASLGAEITDASAIAHARRGLELARSTGRPGLIGRMEWGLGAVIAHATDDPEAFEHLRTARRLLQPLPGPTWWEPAWDRALLDLNLAAYLPPDDELKPDHVRRAISGFERLGDRVLLAAALLESFQLWGQADESSLLANLDRSVEILREADAPYWYGHALLVWGATQGRRGDADAAAASLAEAAAHLQRMGDLNCWATATRRGAMADASRGQTAAAVAGLARMIEAIPRLPMAESHMAVSLDAAAEVLLAAGRPEAAAYALGAALQVETEMHAAFGRGPIHARLRQQLEALLGPSSTEQSMAEGASAGTDVALATVTDRLQQSAGSEAA